MINKISGGVEKVSAALNFAYSQKAVELLIQDSGFRGGFLFLEIRRWNFEIVERE